jgi:hypothetical protein
MSPRCDVTLESIHGDTRAPAVARCPFASPDIETNDGHARRWHVALAAQPRGRLIDDAPEGRACSTSRAPRAAPGHRAFATIARLPRTAAARAREPLAAIVRGYGIFFSAELAE